MLDQFTMGPGLHVAMRYKNFIPEAHFSVLHDFVDTKQSVISTFLGGGDSFPTMGITPSKTLYETGLGVTTIQNDRYKITAHYNFDFRPGLQSHSGYVQFYYFLR